MILGMLEEQILHLKSKKYHYDVKNNVSANSYLLSNVVM